MISATAKTFYYTAQQRIQLRNPLISFYQNLDTFQFKAISDTLITLEQMEKERTAYRASLLWMKSLSSKLDPDSFPELEKFRKIQNHVRKTKQKYDKKKIDCIQKVDMLNASRCNMLSQTLANYQTAWLTFWSNSSYTIASISNCFEGCQLYEASNEIASLKNDDQNNKHDLISKIGRQSKDLMQLEGEDDNLANKIKIESNRAQKEEQLGKEIDLINIDDSLDLNLFADSNLIKSSQDQLRKKQVDDLLTSNANLEDLILLDELLNWNANEPTTASTLDQTSQFAYSNNLNNLNNLSNEQIKQEDASQMNKNKSKSDVEKKKWMDLFADFDDVLHQEVFNQKDLKKNRGDC